MVNGQIPDSVLEQIRTAGLVLPRAPYPGQEWKPRTPAEQHLLQEGHRLNQALQAALGEIGRLRHERAVLAARRQRIQAAPDTQEHAAAADRARQRLSNCPLSPGQLAVLVAAAAGESAADTARRLLIPYDTIRSRRQRLTARLAARNTTHAVAIAVAAGWITGEEITGGVTP